MATKSKKVSVSKKELAQTAEAMETEAVVTGLEGAAEAEQGAEKLKVARKAVRAGAAELAAGASDLTRAVDVQVVADRMATLSEAVATAGVADIAQGAQMLAASDDVEVMSAVVGLMGVADFENGLQLARLSGELETISDVLERLQMPVLSALLDDRGELLQSMAVETIMRAGSTRGLAQAMAAAGQTMGDLGKNEVAEGALRMAVSEGMAERSASLAVAGEALAKQGLEEMQAAETARNVARRMARSGVEEVAAGAAEMGAAVQMEADAAALDEAAGPA